MFCFQQSSQLCEEIIIILQQGIWLFKLLSLTTFATHQKWTMAYRTVTSGITLGYSDG